MTIFSLIIYYNVAAVLRPDILHKDVKLYAECVSDNFLVWKWQIFNKKICISYALHFIYFGVVSSTHMCIHLCSAINIKNCDEFKLCFITKFFLFDTVIVDVQQAWPTSRSRAMIKSIVAQCVTYILIYLASRKKNLPTGPSKKLQ